MRSSEEPGGKKNGPNRSATLALHASQRQPGGARWKLAARVSAAHGGFRDTYLWLGTPISVRPQPYWIPPWKCLFLSPSHQDASRPLISSLFIKESPEETPPGLWLEGPWSRQREECGVAATLFSSLVALMAWNGVRLFPPQCCVIAETESAIQFPSIFFFSSIWLTPTAEPRKAHQVGTDCRAVFGNPIVCKLHSDASLFLLCHFLFFLYMALSC